MALSINNTSALNALATKQAVSSNNIANIGSSKFKKSTAVIEEGINGTVTSKVQRVETPGVMINQADGSLKELSNVDLAQELTGMIPTRHNYEANLKALQVQDEMEAGTLDLIG